MGMGILESDLASQVILLPLVVYNHTILQCDCVNVNIKPT